MYQLKWYLQLLSTLMNNASQYEQISYMKKSTLKKNLVYAVDILVFFLSNIGLALLVLDALKENTFQVSFIQKTSNTKTASRYGHKQSKCND